MNWLFDNPLANLPGIYFLLLYAVVIVTALIVYRIVKANLDVTARMPVPPIPSEPDPFEIAFLRGGANELARSVVFDLTQKNLLGITNGDRESWIQQLAQAETGNLKPLEYAAYQWFNQPRQPKEIFAKGGLSETLQPFAITYEAGLKAENC